MDFHYIEADPLLHPPPHFCGGGKRWGSMLSETFAQTEKMFRHSSRKFKKSFFQRLRALGVLGVE
jgi:hypothetical protein